MKTNRKIASDTKSQIECVVPEFCSKTLQSKLGSGQALIWSFYIYLIQFKLMKQDKSSFNSYFLRNLNDAYFGKIKWPTLSRWCRAWFL